jgi:hypothetical protein
MIKGPQTSARQSEKERWDALRGMSVAESIAIGEALLASDVMRKAEFPDDDHPLSLAIALGVRPTARSTEAFSRARRAKDGPRQA